MIGTYQLVTPRLAKPIDRRKITLPTDGFVSPNDVEFYLLGKGASLDFDKYQLDGGSKANVISEPDYQFSTGDGGTDGQFGHSL